MIAVCFTANAQQISKESFEKAVDFVNCKSVELSLKKSSTKGVTAQFQAYCNCKESPDFKKINLAIPSTETKTIELSNEIDKVKVNEYNSILGSDDAIKLLIEDIFSNKTKYQKLYDFAFKRKDDPSLVSLKKELKEGLSKEFSVQSTAVANSETTNDYSEERPLEPKVENGIDSGQSRSDKNNEKSWFGGFTFQIDIFSMVFTLVIGILIYKILSNKRLHKSDEISLKIKEYIDEEINKTVSCKGNSNQNSSNTFNKNLENEIERIKKELIRIEHISSNRNIPMEVIYHPQEETYVEKIKPEEKVPPEFFFLSNPNLDGSFNESSASPHYREGASMYKFTKVGNNKAKFQIDDRETSIKLALQYPDRNIIPVCDSINEYESKYNRLSTLNQGEGEVELNNGKWKVILKAKIKYES